MTTGLDQGELEGCITLSPACPAIASPPPGEPQTAYDVVAVGEEVLLLYQWTS